MQQKMTRINTLRVIDPADVQGILNDISKVVKDFNYRQIRTPINGKSTYNKIGSNIYSMIKHGKHDSLITSVIEISDAIVDYQTKHCPELLAKNKYVYLVPVSEWYNLWREYNCGQNEFEKFCEGMSIKFSTISALIHRKNHKQRPRFSTNKVVSAFFLMKKAEVDKFSNYTQAKTVNFNPLGAKLQLKELRARKFWKDQNAATN